MVERDAMTRRLKEEEETNTFLGDVFPRPCLVDVVSHVTEALKAVKVVQGSNVEDRAARRELTVDCSDLRRDLEASSAPESERRGASWRCRRDLSDAGR